MISAHATHWWHWSTKTFERLVASHETEHKPSRISSLGSRHINDYLLSSYKYFFLNLFSITIPQKYLNIFWEKIFGELSRHMHTTESGILTAMSR